MLSIGMLSLVCALTSGVFGFGVGAPDGWTWAKGSFFLFLLVAVVGCVGSTMRRPSLVWEVVDEVQRKRFRKRIRTCRLSHSHQAANVFPVGRFSADRAEQGDVASEGDTACNGRNRLNCSSVVERM